MADKSSTQNRIAHAVFELELKKGHQKWSVAELARKAKISRPIVYRYFGKSKEEVLKAAIKHFSDVIYVEAQDVKAGREALAALPSAIVFYQKWRTQPGWVTDEFQRYEKEFQKKLTKTFPKLSMKQAPQLHALMHGLTTAPWLTGDQANETFVSLSEILRSLGE